MLFIVIEIFTFIFCLIFRNTRIVGGIGLAGFAFLAGAASPVTTTDYPTYEYWFDHSFSGGYYFEKGYSRLAELFRDHGYQYSQFRLFFAFLIAIILFIGVARFTKNVAFFVFIYGITIFFNDATQIRNFMMIALVIMAMSFLTIINVKNVVIALTLVLLSGQFHSLGYLFLMVLVIRLIPDKYLKRTLGISVAFTTLLALFVGLFGVDRVLSSVTKIVTLVAKRSNLVDKLSSQYSNGSPFSDVMLLAISTAAAVMILYYILSINDIDRITRNKIKSLYSGALVSLLALPTLFLSVDYSRIQRNAFLFTIIGVALFIERYKTNRKVKALVVASFIMTCFVVALVNYKIWGPLYQESIWYLSRIRSSN